MKQRKHMSSSGKYCHGRKEKTKKTQNEQMNLVLKKTVAARQTVTVKSRSVAVIFFFFALFSIEMGTKKGNIHRAKTDFGTKEDSEESFFKTDFPAAIKLNSQ